MGLVRLPCFFNCVQRIEKYSTTSSKMIKVWNWWFIFSHISKPWKQAPDLVFSKTEKKSNRNQHHPVFLYPVLQARQSGVRFHNSPLFLSFVLPTHTTKDNNHNTCLLCVQKLKIKHNHTNKCSPVCFACS